MDVETLSNRILDDVVIDESDVHDNTENSLTHYGVLGMKWGVRKDRTTTTKKRDRRYENETKEEYKIRMNREHQERLAKISAKSKEASESRTERMQKRTLKSQEKQAKMQIKAAERQMREQRKEKARQEKDAAERERKIRQEALRAANKAETKKLQQMSDKEIKDALARWNLSPKSSLKGAAILGGGILLNVGTAVVTKQLTELGNQQLENYLVKHGYMKKPQQKSNNSGGNP